MKAQNHPALTSTTWRSMGIDPFLFKFHQTVEGARFRSALNPKGQVGEKELPGDWSQVHGISEGYVAGNITG